MSAPAGEPSQPAYVSLTAQPVAMARGGLVSHHGLNSSRPGRPWRVLLTPGHEGTGAQRSARGCCPFSRCTPRKGPTAVGKMGHTWETFADRTEGYRNFQLRYDRLMRCWNRRNDHPWGQFVRSYGPTKALAWLSRSTTGQAQNLYWGRGRKARTLAEPRWHDM
jgi:hypothetical protein